MQLDDILVNYQDAVVKVLHDKGLTYDEMIKIKINDVDFKNGLIKLNNNLLNISNNISVINKAVKEDMYLYDNGESGEMEKLEITEFVIRGTVKEPSSIDLIKKRLELINRVINNQ